MGNVIREAPRSHSILDKTLVKQIDINCTLIQVILKYYNS